MRKPAGDEERTLDRLTSASLYGRGRGITLISSYADEPIALPIMLIGYARVSKGDEQSTTPQRGALRSAGVERTFEEHASGGRWDRPGCTA